jgi:methylated-DNA-[protein]-cysteine S-methyltransferase
MQNEERAMNSETIHSSIYQSPVGSLTIVTDDQSALHELWLSARPGASAEIHPTARIVARQLDEYFAGARYEFDLELAAGGTEFEKLVWAELLRIPYGQTRSYGQIATAIGEPGAARGVGAANHTNPIAIVIPCHRVIGADGSLVGYGGGLEMKRKLLELEGALQPSLF